METPTAVTFPIEWVRDQFPAVRAGETETPPFAFMDNAAGAQVPRPALERVQSYFTERNVYPSGPYPRAARTREAVSEVRRELAALVGASGPGDLVFGQNATTLLCLFAKALGRILEPGDEIITTQLEHEANVTPWLRLARDGAVLKFWQPRGDEARLHVDDLRTMLTERTRLVAMTGASNVLAR